MKRKRTPSIYYDATSGELIKETTKTAGGNFLYRFHFELYGIPKSIGRWIVGIATMFMFVAIITGIIIHKKIFKDIFTFRPKNNTRGWMDAHILPAVAVLPFLIMITYSGLILFNNVMFPYAMKAYYGDNFREYRQDISRVYAQNDKKTSNMNENKKDVKENRKDERQNKKERREKDPEFNTNKQHKMIDKDISIEGLSTIINKSEKIWPENIGGFAIIKNEKEVLIEVTPKDPSSLFSSKGIQELIVFNAKTSKIVKEVNPPILDSITLNTNIVLRSLHQAKFADSTLRVIFFLAGILGTVVAGTGLILWVEKRKKKNQKEKSFGFWLVEKLNLGTITGIFIAIAIFFIANRFIIVDENQRKSVEISIFFITWLLTYIYAFIRNTSKAWKELLLLTSILFISLPILNAIFIFDNFVEFFNRDNIFIYFDIVCIFTGLIFVLIRFISIRIEKRKGVRK